MNKKEKNISTDSQTVFLCCEQNWSWLRRNLPIYLALVPSRYCQSKRGSGIWHGIHSFLWCSFLLRMKILDYYWKLWTYTQMNWLISSKGDKSSIILIYNLSQHILSFIGKLFLEEIIDINYFELILKILITFAIKDSITFLEENPSQQNNIDNLITSIEKLKNKYIE